MVFNEIETMVTVTAATITLDAADIAALEEMYRFAGSLSGDTHMYALYNLLEALTNNAVNPSDNLQRALRGVRRLAKQ